MHLQTFRPQLLVHLLFCLMVVACSNSNEPNDDSGSGGGGSGGTQTQPNILLIISDDQGLDASAQYSASQDLPNTPVLNSLAAQGIVFENAWATPSCTTTRGSLITGKHGVNSGIDRTPDLLDTATTTLQRHLSTADQSASYETAVIGKWHLAGGNTGLLDHPTDSGIGYYAGTIEGVISDYFSWPLTQNGATQTESTYHTTALTNLAIDWVGQQSSPWFLWLAYVAPHSPFHLPPTDLHSRTLSGDATDIDNNTREYYLAAIEAMDKEIGRLLDSLPAETRDNTLIVFVGDNGTPRTVIDVASFPQSHGKGSLYEGGVRVPMIVSGKGVTRANERESAMVNTVDFFPTFSAAAGLTAPAGLDGTSFLPLLSAAGASARQYNYTEYISTDVTGWAVRSDTLKLIEFADGTRELYELSNSIREENNVINQANYATQIAALDAFAAQIRAAGSGGSGGGGGGTGDAEDITNALLVNRSANCADYANAYSSRVLDVNSNLVFDGSLAVSLDNGKCTFSTNAIPNHDFNDGAQPFPNPVSAQSDLYEITATPVAGANTTALSLAQDNAIMLNGVKVDILAAACFGVGNERTGCTDPAQPWRFDPMFAANGFRVDSHNAHSQPNGGYHYHGTPNALFADDPGAESPVVGFAGDGFPVYGSYFNDGNAIRKAVSSFQLRSGTRPSTTGNPGGTFDGTYRDDYEFVIGSGDLDECNGMTHNGQYGYYITDGYPYVLSCYRGTPDASFLK